MRPAILRALLAFLCMWCRVEPDRLVARGGTLCQPPSLVFCGWFWQPCASRGLDDAIFWAAGPHEHIVFYF